MNSCLYECRVLHARLAPKAHRFSYRMFLCALDLDELPALHRTLRLFSLNRPNLYSFRESDYCPTHEATTGLKQRVIDFLATRGVDLTQGRVMLVTLPRIAGYLFNPVSFYFCYDRQGAPVAALAEVTNTFKEMKLYCLGPDAQSAAEAGVFHQRMVKHFYVSPFSDVDVAFDFTLRTPDERLAVQIDDYTGSTRTLTSTLHGRREALTDARLAWYTLKHPLLTLRIITLIHWHAARLWWKKLPWFAKAARPEAQRDLYRPHHTLANAPKA